MARYRYLLTDLLTGDVLSDAVTLTVSQYARRLCQPSDLSATLDLGSSAVRQLTDPIGSTEPRRTALHIIRNEVPVWSGIIWTRHYRSAENNLDLTVSSWESYFARRRIRRDYGFFQWDQNEIIHNLFWTAQAESVGGYGDVGIATPVPQNSGILRDRTYYWHERATYLERMQQLAGVINGPDFTIEPRWDEYGLPGSTLLIGTPLGSPNAQVLEFPGDIRNYSWPDDGGDSANYWSAIGDKPAGAGQDDPPLIRDAQVSAEWAAGIPLLEDVSTHSGVTDPGTLSGYAIANVLASVGNRVVPEATVQLAANGALPGLGDTLRLRITDPYRWPAQPGTGAPGLVVDVRITGWTVNISEAGETLTATLAALQEDAP